MSEIKYKSNSHKSKSEAATSSEDVRKKTEKVVKGAVKTKKKSGLKDVFISEDIANVKSYVIMDVLIPAVKKAISDIVTDGIDMILYGESGRTKKKSSKVSYQSYYDRDDRRSSGHTRTRSGYSYDDVILESRGEAEEVLERMDELIDTYGMCSVADMYDLVGVSCEYTDNKYGWTNLRNADIARTRDGYLLKLPRALPIK